MSEPSGGLGGDHRRVRRRPPRSSGGHRRGAATGRGGRSPIRRGHLRPTPGTGDPSRFGAAAVDRPGPEARAARGDGRRLRVRGPLRPGTRRRDCRGLRPDGPAGLPPCEGGGRGRGLPLRPPPARECRVAGGDGVQVGLHRARAQARRDRWPRCTRRRTGFLHSDPSGHPRGASGGRESDAGPTARDAGRGRPR